MACRYDRHAGQRAAYQHRGVPLLVAGQRREPIAADTDTHQSQAVTQMGAAARRHRLSRRWSRGWTACRQTTRSCALNRHAGEPSSLGGPDNSEKVRFSRDL